MAAHYIDDPIYMRGAFLTSKNTYGRSGCPFTCGVTSRDYDYGPHMVPDAVKGLSTVVVRRIHEHMSEEDIRDVAAAINKVAQAMSV